MNLTLTLTEQRNPNQATGEFAEADFETKAE